MDERSPDMLFERHWALTLLDEVLARLAQEFSRAGKRELFQQLQPFLVEATQGKTYREVARELGLTEEAVKKSVQRMRSRYHQLFREEIAHMVGCAEEVEDELRDLCAIVSG